MSIDAILPPSFDAAGVRINNFVAPDEIVHDLAGNCIHVHVETYWRVRYDKPFAIFAIELRRRTRRRLDELGGLPR